LIVTGPPWLFHGGGAEQVIPQNVSPFSSLPIVQTGGVPPATGK
jgi:hypothetical protein